MTGHESDERFTIQTLEMRVRKLEKRVRVQNKRVWGAAALVGSVALLGATTVVAPDVLSARSFQLVDESGRVVGRWVSGAGDVVRLEALGARGELVAGIELVSTEPHVRVIGAGGKEAPSSSAIRETAPQAAARRKGARGKAAAEPNGADGDGKAEGEAEDPFGWVQ